MRLGDDPALGIADAVYRNLQTRDENGSRHLLLAEAETFWLLHLGVIVEDNGDIAAVRWS